MEIKEASWCPALGIDIEAVPWGSVFTLRGEFGPPEAGRAFEKARSQVRVRRHHAAICDYSAAAPRLTPQQMLDSSGAGAVPGSSIPTALVVAAEHIAWWRSYAYLQGMRGCLRGVFVTRAAALRWVVEQAGIRQAQIRYRAPC